MVGSGAGAVGSDVSDVGGGCYGPGGGGGCHGRGGGGSVGGGGGGGGILTRAREGWKI